MLIYNWDMNNKNKQKRTWTFKEIASEKGKETAEEKRLAQWITKEITSREYTQEEIDALIYLSKNGKKEEMWKIFLKGHKCPDTCYCQKETKTWKEKIQKGTKFTELAEKEIKEAEELRIKETTELLFKNPQKFFNNDHKWN